MSTDIQPATSTDIQPAIVHSRHPKAEVLQVIVYAHSALFYWWPLWVGRNSNPEIA